MPLLPSALRPLGPLVAVILAVSVAAPASAASRKRCGTTSAAGVTMRVTIYDDFNVGFSYSCRTARGVMRAYARTRPTQRDPLGTVTYRGRRWDCYLDRYSSGYSCAQKRARPKAPHAGGKFV